VNYRKIFGASTLALMVAISTTAAWGQMAPQSTGSVTSASGKANALQQDVARKINDAWGEHKDASGAAAFQENGEIAMSEGDSQKAERYFEAAEHELSALKPSMVAGPLSSNY
jgi:hypothetical protein